jgi:hypothetical protein
MVAVLEIEAAADEMIFYKRSGHEPLMQISIA